MNILHVFLLYKNISLEVVLIIVVPEIAEPKILQSVFIIMRYVNGKLKIYRNNGSVVVCYMINDIDDT